MAKQEDKQKDSALWETVKTVVFAVLIAVAIRTVAYEPFKIPSGSMRPNLLIGDYLFVSKFSYGYSKYSLPFDLPLLPKRIFFSEPERGDIVVFRPTGDIKSNFIKRLVGLPGDEVEIRQGRLHINGELTDRRFTDTISTYANLGRSKLGIYEETLPEANPYLIHELDDARRSDDMGPYFVPEGHYFMMGDNRDFSSDSRYGPKGHPGNPNFIPQQGSVGYVPAENLIGRADILFFSIEEGGRFWEFWKWPFRIRWTRLFKSLG